MKRVLLIIIFFFSVISYGQDDPDPDDVVETTVFLTAEGSESNMYTLISSALSEGGDSIDAPDKSDECTAHSSGAKHIVRVTDDVFNRGVFGFSVHESEDNLGCSHDSDIQRTEIKTYDKAPDLLLGTLEETIQYRWEFKIPSDFQPSESFTHLHQLISVLDSGEEKPLITLTATKQDTVEVMELQYINDFGAKEVLTSSDLTFFKGSWVSVTETIEYGTSGRYQIIVSNGLSGAIILSHSSENIKTWSDETIHAGAKWGINRDTDVLDPIKDEQVLFDAFMIYQDQEDDEDDPFVEDVPDPDVVNFCTEEVQYRVPTHHRFYLYHNPYKDERGSANLSDMNSYRIPNRSCSVRSSGGSAGEYITYEDIAVWNRNNPCMQIKNPEDLSRLADKTGDKYKNPYGKKHYPVLKDKSCDMSLEEVDEWNNNFPALYIDIPPPPVPDIPEEPEPDDDDVTVTLPEEPTITPPISEEATVFSLAEETQTLGSLAFLAGETANIILPDVPKEDYDVKKFDNNERDEHGHKKRSDNKKKWYDIGGIAKMTGSLAKAAVESMKTASLGYYDPAGMFIRIAEKDQIKRYADKSKQSATKFGQVAATTVLENLDRQRFDMDAGMLPFFSYRNDCNNYLNPSKKKECQRSIDYLEDALQTVNQVIYSYDRRSPYNTGGYFKPTRGISEQIREKYVAIQNKIFRELEQVKAKSEKEGLLNVLRH